MCESRGQHVSHVIAFDDAPFPPQHRGDVLLVAAVFARLRLEGVLTGKVRRDGANATDCVIRMVSASRFRPQLQLIMLQGIAVAGFNVFDIQRLHRVLGLPVLTVTRHTPDQNAVRTALTEKVSGGRNKWRLIEKAGAPEAIAGVHVHRAGITRQEAAAVIGDFAVNSRIPEPLRTAHLIAGGMAQGESRHRV
jgi:endonuclease V-like protein UPF0215 family